ncbi:MAG: DUF4169 family protein [Qingshengfaniella sp.]
MAEAPINLNRARKERARDARRKQAEANAVRFGRSKAEKARDTAEATRQADHLDAHRRDEDPA